MPLKTKPDIAADVTGDTETFTEFIRKLVAVPQSEIKAAMEEWRGVKGESPYASRARRASSKIR